MLLIDTNIFLELLLGQERASECEEFLGKVSRGDIEAVVTKFTVHAIEVVLNEPASILVFLRNVQNSVGLSVYETTIEDEIAASVLMGKVGLDFNDSLQYFVAKKLGAEAIVSYDKHFDKVDVPRREPRDFL